MRFVWSSAVNGFAAAARQIADKSGSHAPRAEAVRQVGRCLHTPRQPANMHDVPALFFIAICKNALLASLLHLMECGACSRLNEQKQKATGSQ
jgi:hypothetical protein